MRIDVLVHFKLHWWTLSFTRFLLLVLVLETKIFNVIYVQLRLLLSDDAATFATIANVTGTFPF